jgi:hypothetical protein
MKQAMNPLARGWVDLNLTGHLYNGIVANRFGDTLIIESEDPEAIEKTERYKHVWGLNDTSRSELMHSILRPIFRTQIEESIGLKFGS